MLAIRPKMHRSSCPPATGLSDQSRPSHGGEHDAGIEGVIYFTPDGEGYVLYATSRPTAAGAGAGAGAGASPAGPSGS
jgi:hypothetical protein